MMLNLIFQHVASTGIIHTVTMFHNEAHYRFTTQLGSTIKHYKMTYLKMDASGYREMAPPGVQEEDIPRVFKWRTLKLTKQLQVISGAVKKLDVQNWQCSSHS
jgi:hypothetical protein